MPIIAKVGAFAGSYCVLGKSAVSVCWRIEPAKVLVLAANLSNDAVERRHHLDGDMIWHEGPEPTESTMGPWSVNWFLAKWESPDLPNAG